MSQVEDVVVAEALSNGKELTATGKNIIGSGGMGTNEAKNRDDCYKNGPSIGLISTSAAAEAAMLAGIDVDAKPAPVPATPKKAVRKRGGAAAANGGPVAPTTPKSGSKRAAGSDLPDGVASPKKTKTETGVDPNNPGGAASITDNVDGESKNEVLAESKSTKGPKTPKTPKPPKAPKVPKAPKTPKTPKNAEVTADGTDGEPKSTGRKRASPTDGQKPAAALSIPLFWDAAEEHDRKLVEMKKAGNSWGEINKMWVEVTGRVAKGSTLPNRYIRLMANFAQLQPGEDAMLLAAVEKYDKEKWQSIAALMDTVDGNKYAAAFLQKEYKKIQDAISNGTFVPSTNTAPASTAENMDDEDEEAKNVGHVI